jgi:hypothetical protein
MVTLKINYGPGIECVSGSIRADRVELAFCFVGGEHFYTIVFGGGSMWIHAPFGATGCTIAAHSSETVGSWTRRDATCWDYVCVPGNCGKSRTTEFPTSLLSVWQASGGAPFKPSGPGHIRFLALGPTGMGVDLNPCYRAGAAADALYNCYRNNVHSMDLSVNRPLLLITDLSTGQVTINCDEDPRVLPPDPGDTWKKNKAECWWTQSPASPGFEAMVYRPPQP